MKHFCVFSGFLGSGKTTTMMALAAHDPQTAIISNDLGGRGLADSKLGQLAGLRSSELTGDCICYQTQALADRLDDLFSQGAELVISDIPGFGVGALEHVYHTLHDRYRNRYTLAPFTVLTEPAVVSRLRSGGDDLGYILDAQLQEADLIVLNKIDLLSPGAQEETAAWLSVRYPHARVIPVSALTGEGIPHLHRLLTGGTASLRRPDIGYGGPAFTLAMGLLSEYYLQYHTVVCCDTFDANAFLSFIAAQVRTRMTQAGFEIPHLKLLAWEPEGGYAKLDLIGTGRPIQHTHPLDRPVTELAVVLNASAQCPPNLLDQIITGAVGQAAAAFRLENTIYKKECFGMGGA